MDMRYVVLMAAFARCESMWSIAGITVAMLVLLREKKRVASLKICLNKITRLVMIQKRSNIPSKHSVSGLQSSIPPGSTYTHVVSEKPECRCNGT